MTYNTELRTQALDAYLHSGANTSTIATGFGVSPSSLTQWAKGEGIPLRRRGRKKDKAPSVKAMHRLNLLAGGMTMEQVGIETGVSKQAISALAKRWHDLLRDLTHNANVEAPAQAVANAADRSNQSGAPQSPAAILIQNRKDTQMHSEEPTSTPQPDQAPTSTSTIREIALSEIDLKHAIQTRRSVNKEKVSEYCERMKAGDQFPPLNLYDVDNVLVTADGIHRRMSAEDAGKTTISCIVTKGTRADALRAALEANTAHGLPRSNKDKRHAVALALTEYSEWSDHVIADLVKTSHTFVGKLRKELATNSSSSTGFRTGKDGRKRKEPKSNKSTADTKSDAPQPGEDQSELTTDPTAQTTQDQPGENESQPEMLRESKSVPTAAWDGIKQMLLQAVAPLDASARKEISDLLINFAESLTAPGQEGIVE
jgi:transposase-like protein